MSARSKLLILAFCLLLVLAAASLYQLFALRFEAGDIFPAGSSLRSDPQGSMALYQALERTGGVEVERNYRYLSSRNLSGCTILMLGTGQKALLLSEYEEDLPKLAATGNRVIVAYKQEEFNPLNMTRHLRTMGLRGVGWGVIEGEIDAKSPYKARLMEQIPSLPSEVNYYSRLSLQPPPTGWRTIYAVDGKAVVLERSIGSGSLVLVSDSSLFSNEALKADRQAALLVWLLGEHRRIIFDEFHLGVSEQGGIMMLARRFGLLPLIGVLLLMAGLYIWQQSIPLNPAGAVASRDPAVGVTHDSFSGLVNLLQRSIPANQLLKVCCQEWQKSFKRELQQDAALRKELSDAMTAQDDPVTRYQRIARLRAERTGR